MKWRIYIDESGNPDLESSANPNHRFLSLTGIAVELSKVENTLFPELESLKREFFKSHPDEPIILHRKELVNAKPPFEVLKDPDIRQRFDRDLLAFLKKWEYIVFTVCIDKLKHKETYQTWRYDPYHYCLEVLMERFVFFLEEKDNIGDVMAESRGGKEDMRLKKSFRRLWEQGTNFIESARIKERLTSCELKVKPKANNIAGLQLADIIAHSCRDEILLDAGYSSTLAPFSKEIINILKNKYYQRNGKISGFGKKLL